MLFPTTFALLPVVISKITFTIGHLSSPFHIKISIWIYFYDPFPLPCSIHEVTMYMLCTDSTGSRFFVKLNFLFQPAVFGQVGFMIVLWSCNVWCILILLAGLCRFVVFWSRKHNLVSDCAENSAGLKNKCPGSINIIQHIALDVWIVVCVALYIKCNNDLL